MIKVILKISGKKWIYEEKKKKDSQKNTVIIISSLVYINKYTCQAMKL